MTATVPTDCCKRLALSYCGGERLQLRVALLLKDYTNCVWCVVCLHAEKCQWDVVLKNSTYLDSLLTVLEVSHHHH